MTEMAPNDWSEVMRGRFRHTSPEAVCSPKRVEDRFSKNHTFSSLDGLEFAQRVGRIQNKRASPT